MDGEAYERTEVIVSARICTHREGWYATTQRGGNVFIAAGYETCEDASKQTKIPDMIQPSSKTAVPSSQ